jgi:sporulation protein YlmC with PRC-barrel domain
MAGCPDRGPRIFRRVSEDDGYPIHYGAVERGTAVYASDGVRVGKVDEVIDNYQERILDGFVIEDEAGELRFVDGPEVARTSERAVRLTIDSGAAAKLPPPEKAPPTFSPRRAGRLGKMLGGNWRRR